VYSWIYGPSYGSFIRLSFININIQYTTRERYCFPGLSGQCCWSNISSPKCNRWMAISLKVLKGALLQTRLSIFISHQPLLCLPLSEALVWRRSVMNLSDVCLHCSGLSSCMAKANQRCQTSLKRNDTYWYSDYLHLLLCSTQPAIQTSQNICSSWNKYELILYIC